MKVRILQDGTYSDFEVPGRPNKIGAKYLAAGDVVNYPDWYAESLIASGLAEIYAESKRLFDATDAAFAWAIKLDVDLRAIKGTGVGGRITVGDVRKAAG